jgi:predicted DNA-binding transcriptional regulator AlpA
MSDLELLTAADCARLLKLSVRQVWNLTRSDRLPRPVTIGRFVRWRASDIQRFIDAGGNLPRLDELERKCDQQFAAVFQAIRELTEPPSPKKGRIGFVTDDRP